MSRAPPGARAERTAARCRGSAGPFKLVAPAFACAAVAIAAVVRWGRQPDPGPAHAPVEIGAGIRLPFHTNGASSQAWWATAVLVLMAGATFAWAVFTYLYLWPRAPSVQTLPRFSARDANHTRTELVAGAAGR